jgi:pimeloyl-ACP methyl ester carboxylesterase
MDNLPISQDAMTRIQQLNENATGNTTVIHQGFFDYYNIACKKGNPQDPLYYNYYNPLSLREQISTAITAAGSNLSIKTLTFTGHSLGAALAAIAALDANTLAWDVAVGATAGTPAKIRTFTYAQPRIGGSVESFHIILKEIAEEKSLEALKFVYGLSGSSTALLHRIANTNDLVTTGVFPLITSGFVNVKHFITHYPLDARPTHITRRRSAIMVCY